MRPHVRRKVVIIHCVHNFIIEMSRELRFRGRPHILCWLIHNLKLGLARTVMEICEGSLVIINKVVIIIDIIFYIF